MAQVKKRKSQAFGKDIYLLGIDEEGKNVWLEKASWDCSWYWGFGYLETYTNNKNPERARDISSHTHYDSMILNKKDCHHLNDLKGFKSVLTDNEAWQLSDLMKTFYTLKSTAGLYHQGNSHYTSVPFLSLKDLEKEKEINEILLPKVFEAIYSLLEPK